MAYSYRPHAEKLIVVPAPATPNSCAAWIWDYMPQIHLMGYFVPSHVHASISYTAAECNYAIFGLTIPNNLFI